METYITAIKDILVIVAPIVIAYISYRSNKKTTHDIRLELEKSLKEKDADTTQMLTKIMVKTDFLRHGRNIKGVPMMGHH